MTSPFRPNLFEDKVAVVTGGTSGLGAGTSKFLAEHGAKVYAVGLGADQVSFPSELDIHVSEVDVTKDEDLKGLFNSLDQLDILVPAAGITLGDKELEWESFNKVLSIQLNGVYRTINLAHDLLVESRGTVITFASMLSYFGGGTAVAYSSAKGAIVQMTKSLAQAYASDGIRVNAVAPGWVNSELMNQVREMGVADQILARTPMGRFGEPEEIGQVIAFLASDAASYVTGAVLPVDGGYLVTGM